MYKVNIVFNNLDTVEIKYKDKLSMVLDLMDMIETEQVFRVSIYSYETNENYDFYFDEDVVDLDLTKVV
ncbi:MAG: hypothetical protein ACP5G1_04805 [Nanopusillaceae archaeon]